MGIKNFILTLILLASFGCLEKKEDSIKKTSSNNSKTPGGGSGSSEVSQTPAIPTYNNNLAWITQLGDTTSAPGGSNSGSDLCYGVAVDSSGNVYCAGQTNGALGETNGNTDNSTDAFVMKVNSSGSLAWVKQLGSITTVPGGDTSSWDLCSSTTVDSSGNVYCAGNTSGNLGEANGGVNDAFVMKLDSLGNIVWITQLGASTKAPGGNNSSSDTCFSVATDSAGNVYCAGHTYGAMGEANGGGSDAFVLKLNSSGSLVWLKHFGAATTVPGGSTSGDDSCKGVAVDSSGNVYCSGYTKSSFGESFGGGKDAFVMKLNSSGSLVWIKQLGATTTVPGGSISGEDYCNSVAIDSSDNVYCAGNTASALGESNGGSFDAFVMKLDSSGNIDWLTQMGSSTTASGGNNNGAEYCNGVTVDREGNIYCAGRVVEAGFTPGAGNFGETIGGSSDAFILKLDSSGGLVWVKQLGSVTVVPGGDTSMWDECTGVSVDSSGSVYCAGKTSSALGEGDGGGVGSGGGTDLFIMKLN